MNNTDINCSILANTINIIPNDIIITNHLFEIIYYNQSAGDNLTYIIGSSINFAGLQIQSLFYDLSAILYNNTSVFTNKRVVISAKKKIYGEMLYSSLSDTNTNLVYNVCINSFTIQKLEKTELYHTFVLCDIQNTDTTINDFHQKKQNNFVAYLSHELRNPLQSIIMSNYLLKKQITAISESITDKADLNCTKIMSYINTMEKSCNDMRKIINDILDLSKIEARELNMDFELCKISDVIEHIKNYSDSVVIELDNDNIPIHIYTDEVRINQILSNLISNAIKYTNNRDTRIIKVKIIYNTIDNMIEFHVIDNGIGIKTEEINLLFKDGCQTSNNIKINCDSNGIGLCISQKMASLLGGYISVKSEFNIGSTFILHIPNQIIHKPIIQPISNQITQTHISGKILIVDDNSSNLYLLKMLMEHYIYDLNYELEIHAVNSGYDAIQICQVNKYDLIFMDINMMGIDGCTTCKLIKNNGYTNKIIATTGNILAKQDNLRTTKYVCFDDIIIKPYDNNIILDHIQKNLNKV